MERHFDEELKIINEKLIRMATLSEEMIKIAIKVLTDRNDSIVKDAWEKEKEVNDLQIEIDEKVIALMAKMQPVARDLRFLITAVKINNELERIADQSINICENASHLLKYPQLKSLANMPIMADMVQQAVHDGLNSFIRRETSLAQKVLNTDDEIDTFKKQIFNELLTHMMSDSQIIPCALSLILISRNLERIGDHATNIAEEVIYLVDGRDVRHHHEEKER